MASRDSSGRSGFLRLGVPCAGPGSPLGGDGKLGTASTALARSSRNLSNSGGRARRKEGMQDSGRSTRSCEYNYFASHYLHLSRLPRLHLPSVDNQRQQCYVWESKLGNLIQSKPPQRIVLILLSCH